MEPILSSLAASKAAQDAGPRNNPRDLLSRLYREIGISAVAGALEAAADKGEQRPTARQTRAALAKSAA